MLGRRQRTRQPTGGGSTLTDAASAEDDYEAGATADAGDAWEETDEAGDDWEEDAADQVDDEYEDDVYDEEYEDAEDEYDDDESEDEQDAGSSDQFTPPTFLEAAKQAFRPSRLKAGASAGASQTAAAGEASGGLRGGGSLRTRAQPATGTDEDARAVNLIDRRERMIGFVLSGGLFVLSVLAYYADHRYKNHIIAKQLEVRHAAVEVLLIFAILGALTLTATLVRRRAFLGFILAFAGLALLQTLGFFGLIYLAGGGWLIFRAMKTSPRSRARQAALARKSDGGTNGTGARARGSTATTGASSPRAASGARSTGTGSRNAGTSAQRQIGRNNRTAGARGGPAGSGRYTPPKQSRRPPPAKQPEPPEPSNRLTAWLRK